MSELYQFNSSHNVLLIDKKGFVKTIDYKFKDKKFPDRYIKIAAPTKPYKVEFKFNNKTIDDNSYVKIVFEFYQEKYGRYYYKELMEQP